MSQELKVYLYSAAICAAVGLFELVIRLRADRKSPDYDRLTWGSLAVFSICVFIPLLNAIVLFWPMFSRIWDFCERLLDKWSKPIITQERKK